MTSRHTAVVFWDNEILAGHVSVRIIARRERAVYPNDDNAPRRVQLADIGVGMHLAIGGHVVRRNDGVRVRLRLRVGGRCPHRASQQAGTRAPRCAWPRRDREREAGICHSPLSLLLEDSH